MDMCESGFRESAGAALKSLGLQAFRAAGGSRFGNFPEFGNRHRMPTAIARGANANMFRRNRIHYLILR
jgi:hypothetical protein